MPTIRCYQKRTKAQNEAAKARRKGKTVRTRRGEARGSGWCVITGIRKPTKRVQRRRSRK